MKIWKANQIEKNENKPVDVGYTQIELQTMFAAPKGINMKHKTVYFFSDSGHGWLKVKKDELIELCIANDISLFSYMRGEHAYLEEDCDAPRYFKAFLAKWSLPDDFKFDIVESTTDRSSKIRNYMSYNSKT